MTTESDGETRCYRLSKAFRNRAIIYAFGFFAAAVVNFFLTLLCSSPPDLSPLVAASIIGGFWLAWTLLALYLIALHHRYRLWLDATELRQRGVFSEQRVSVARIERLKWHLGLWILSEGPFGVFRVDLDHFERSDRDEIVCFFRRAVNDTIQIGRPEFDAIYFPDPQVLQARREANRRMYRRIANLLLAVGFGYVTAWFVYPWFPTAAAAALQLSFGGIAWVASRRPARTNVA